MLAAGGAGPEGGERISRDSILREAETSLRRLRTDAIDLYQIHSPIPEQQIEEGWSALAELKEQGLARHIGVSNFDVEQLRRTVDRAGGDAAAPLLLNERAVVAEICHSRRKRESE